MHSRCGLEAWSLTDNEQIELVDMDKGKWPAVLGHVVLCVGYRRFASRADDARKILQDMHTGV